MPVELYRLTDDEGESDGAEDDISDDEWGNPSLRQAVRSDACREPQSGRPGREGRNRSLRRSQSWSGDISNVKDLFRGTRSDGVNVSCTGGTPDKDRKNGESRSVGTQSQESGSSLSEGAVVARPSTARAEPGGRASSLSAGDSVTPRFPRGLVPPSLERAGTTPLFLDRVSHHESASSSDAPAARSDASARCEIVDVDNRRKICSSEPTVAPRAAKLTNLNPN